MGTTLQTDHTGVAQATLPAQFRNAPNLLALIEAIIGPSDPTTWGIQELENVFFALRDERWLSTAGGVQLDKLGEILGLHRTSADDGEYREALQVQIVINTSEGAPETLIQLVADITGGAVHLVEKPPAGLHITALGGSSTYALDRLGKAKCTGVMLVVAATLVDTFIYGRARDAAGVQTTITQEHPHGGLGYGVPGVPGSGGGYAALYFSTE